MPDAPNDNGSAKEQPGPPGDQPAAAFPAPEGAIDAPGWMSIDRALATIYPDQPPYGHWGVKVTWRDGGPDPLDGISVWQVEREGVVPHWHLVSYGCTELYTKESELAGQSGFGNELTMRLAREEGEIQPPIWALSFLQNLARYVFQTGRTFGENHYMNLNSAIVQDVETDIRAICFVRDPDLPENVDGPFGAFGFLQLVGIHLDELGAMQDWNTEGVIGLAKQKNPLLVTSLTRDSWMTDAAFRTACEEGAARDGSSQGAVLVEGLLLMRVDRAAGEPEGLELHLDLPSAAQFVRMLDRRINYGRRFVIVSHGAGVEVMPAEEGQATDVSVNEAEGLLAIRLAKDAVEQLRSTLKAEPGRYDWPELLPGLTIAVHEELPELEPVDGDEAGATEGEAPPES